MPTLDRTRDWAADRRWARPLAWILNWELGGLLLVAAVATGLWAFVAIADEVTEGDTRSIDTDILLAMRTADPEDPIGPPWFEEVGRDMTALGGVGVLVMVTLFAAGLVLLQGKRKSALFLVAAVGGGLALSLLLKTGFDRPRPELVPHGSVVYTKSFPSGHAMMSASTYLTLAATLVRTQTRRRLKLYLIAAPVLLTLLIGVSRVYLGVHWPTDVLAGWVAGAVWACFAWMVARWLQIFGRIEQPAESTPPE